MKITDLKIIPFATHADRFRHGVLSPRTKLVQTVTCIETDSGASGYYFGAVGEDAVEHVHDELPRAPAASKASA